MKCYDEYNTGEGNVAYVAQTSWLLNATIRENILFGSEYDSNRYEQVIRDCCLVKDFQNWDGGDKTEIGEKGINLSGGQKQRISLARACYSTARFILLDDPLSAVDAPTARFLLHRAILGSLKGRTCILVSHAVSLVLPYAQYCVLIKNGEIYCKGTPEEIVKNVEAEGTFGLDLSMENFEQENDEEKLAVNANQGAGTALVQDEEKASGAVSWSIYSKYFLSAGGTLYLFFFFLSFFVTNSSSVGNDWWLKLWTDHSNEVEMIRNILPTPVSMFVSDIANEMKILYVQSSYTWTHLGKEISNRLMERTPTQQPNDALFFVGIYALFGLGVMLANNLQLIIVLSGSFIASRRIHSRLLKSVLGAPLRFFEITRKFGID
jgi:ABC-type multidrug transport system fused ATPase/permease subunit